MKLLQQNPNINCQQEWELAQDREVGGWWKCFLFTGVLRGQEVMGK